MSLFSDTCSVAVLFRHAHAFMRDLRVSTSHSGLNLISRWLCLWSRARPHVRVGLPFEACDPLMGIGLCVYVRLCHVRDLLIISCKSACARTSLRTSCRSAFCGEVCTANDPIDFCVTRLSNPIETSRGAPPRFAANLDGVDAILHPAAHLDSPGHPGAHPPSAGASACLDVLNTWIS
jgi:hypothetical protein